ncbi:MAG: methyl-accepting chemotaxis protein [Burkholderiaceae bacterium]
MTTWFDNLRIGTKLLGVLSMVLLLTVLVGVLAAIQLERVGEGARSLAASALPRVRLVSELRATVLEIRAVQYAHMLSDSEEEQKGLKERISGLAAEVARSGKSYEPLVASAQERAAYTEFTRRWAQYLRDNERVLTLTGDFGTKAMGGDYRKLFDAMNDNLSQILQINDRSADALVRDTKATAGQTRLVILGAVTAAVAFGLALGLVMVRRITGSLTVASSSARSVARGDLTRSIPAGGTDEVGGLLSALTEMQAGLRDLVSTVRSGVESVASASSQIASGNQHLSTRTEQQSINLQSTVSAVHAMAEHVRHNTESAQQANQLARNASDIAVRGGCVVQEVVQTMGDITDASRRIVDIIGVIDGIAFQTNILALNAAVEAARAGEQGRGFAVVASEVRSLAQRSATAAKEIKTLIGASVDKVETGARLVHGAGKTMDEIVGSVKRVGDIIGEISAAASEQAAGIDQINHAVAQLDEMTQQNSALVEESAAAAASLKEQGSMLNVAVARFQLY